MGSNTHQKNKDQACLRLKLAPRGEFCLIGTTLYQGMTLTQGVKFVPRREVVLSVDVGPRGEVCPKA
jgi:hypothetical protein